MTTLAKGVEAETQLAIPKSTRGHAFQGYQFFKTSASRDIFDSFGIGNCAKASEFASDRMLSAVGEEARVPGFDKIASQNPNLDETAQLEALYTLRILDIQDEEAFVRILRMITQALDMIMGAIAVVDESQR